MRLKTYTAPSMAEALRQARDELGPDAVILATAKVGKSVRLTAANEHPGNRRAAPEPPSPIGADRLVDAVAVALAKHGVPETLIERLAAIVDGLSGDDPRRALNAALRARFDFRSTAKQAGGQPLLLVGQPGAGKTSSAAKLAALAGAHGRAATLITCDLAKAGAIEQLAIYAKALSVQAFRAKDPESLRRAVDRAVPDGLIIIDSTGSNPFDPAECQALRELAQAAGAEPILVLACGGDPGETGELAQSYAEIGARRLISTRLDASRRLGGILAAADSGRLAFADFGISPEIASGLVPADAAFLCERLLPLAGRRGQGADPVNSGANSATSPDNNSGANRGANSGIAG